MKKYELIASYQLNSVFDLDFDIRDVHSWEVRWDQLIVEFNEGDEPQTFEPSRPYYEDFVDPKNPYETDLFIHKENQLPEHHVL